jgi:D-alanine-D-alanine ligase
MVLRVLHLVGSVVSEFYCDLSRLYAEDCFECNAEVNLYEFHVAYVTPDHQWRFPQSLRPEAIAAASPMPLAAAIQVLSQLKPDVMVPQMFCVPGMTSYRALFDLLNIPYVGNLPDVMALTANKAKAKAVVAAAGVKVPTGELLRRGEVPSLRPPAVVKPVNVDNSLGVTLVTNSADYEAALQTAFTCAEEVLVEAYIELGREVRCGVIVQGDELICLPLEEYAMHPAEQPIRRYEHKLRRNTAGDLEMVAKGNAGVWIVDPSDPITQMVWEAARRCHATLGCRHYSLFDFRIDADQQPWFLEAGLYCSFAQTSVISTMAKAAGMPLRPLFAQMLKNAVDTSAILPASLG